MSEHEFVCSFDEQLAMAKSELISAITRYRENILMRDTKNRAELEVELEKKVSYIRSANQSAVLLSCLYS